MNNVAVLLSSYNGEDFIIELPIPHEVAYEIKVFKVAGPGIPACISSLLLSVSK